VHEGLANADVLEWVIAAACFQFVIGLVEAEENRASFRAG